MFAFLARIFRLPPEPPGCTRAILAEHWARQAALQAERDTWRDEDWFDEPEKKP